MIIKCGRNEFEVTNKDRILDNGAVYILITKKVWSNYSQVSPSVSKTLFKNLLKKRMIQKSEEKYHTLDGGELDLYEFVE